MCISPGIHGFFVDWGDSFFAGDLSYRTACKVQRLPLGLDLNFFC
jgi:hypothetical protein